jgi:hypothetical protein
MTRETVIGDTPEWLATSLIVTSAEVSVIRIRGSGITLYPEGGRNLKG